MQNEILDDYTVDDGKGLSVYARGKAIKAATWMMVSAVCALLVIAITALMMLGSGEWRSWRFEEFCFEVFLAAMTAKYLVLLAKGNLLRKAARSNHFPDLKHTARLNNMMWAIIGGMATLFLLAMLLYLIADIKILGRISNELFRI